MLLVVMHNFFSSLEKKDFTDGKQIKDIPNLKKFESFWIFVFQTELPNFKGEDDLIPLYISNQKA